MCEKEGIILKDNIINYLDEKYSKRLLRIKDFPDNLYYMGNVDLMNKSKIVAIVGSRECSEYGRSVAQNFAKELAKNDICIISGLAKGIDTAAHIGAVYEKGNTIAVLGGGLKNIYPPENDWLFNLIKTKGGLILSEHSKEEKTELHNFPKRNRIISGMADAVLVVEAVYRSGSTITAKYAKESNKKVFCIPGNIDSIRSVGTNRLIMEGAIMVTNPMQIIKELYKGSNIDININQKTENIPTQYKEIYKQLIKEELTSDELSRILNLNINQINSVLTMMEIEGYIKRQSGNVFVIKGKENGL